MFKFSQGIAHLHAQVVVEELCRLGVEVFCLSPGARVMPLVQALKEHRTAEVRLFNDERSAAFWAQGYGKSGGLACLLCTSGTAAANYYPAIIEARLSATPLLVVTADRPIELLYAKANQTIEQRGLYANYPVLNLDIPAPERSVYAHSLLSNLAQAVYAARSNPGPVHINLAYRKPFFDADFRLSDLDASESELLERWYKSGSAYCNFEDSRPAVVERARKKVVEEILEAEKVAVVCGPLSSASSDDSIIELARLLKAPIFADITSGLRFGSSNGEVLALYSLYLNNTADFPTLVLAFGDRIISEPLRRYLERSGARLIMVSGYSLRQDAIENEFIFPAKKFHAEPGSFAAALLESLKTTPERIERRCDEYLRRLQQHEAAVAEKLPAYLSTKEGVAEGAAVCRIIADAPANSTLYLSASMPIREAEYFAGVSPLELKIGCNRGANGIDGVLSSALGFAAKQNAALSVILGDQALLHDLTALSLIRESKKPVWVFVLNNQGGAIFNFFQLGETASMMINPHPWDFTAAAKQFRLKHFAPSSIEELSDMFRTLQTSGESALIEIKTNGEEAVSLFRKSELVG